MSKTCLASLFLIVMLTGCSKIIPKLDQVLPDKRTEYKKSKTLPDLEVPPDLTTDAIRDRMAIPTAGETLSFSTFQERAAETRRQLDLQRSGSNAIKLLDNEHILAVEGVTVQIWPQLREFWHSAGYDLELDDEELGVVETAWKENQEELIRDKFKIFAEPGQEAGTTLLYISHRGEELVGQGDKLVWQPRSRDIVLEREVVERLQEQLGGVGQGDIASRSAHPPDTEAAPHTQRAELISAGGGKIYLTIAEDFGEAWESIATALGRAGIQVEQEDRARGLYFIRLPNTEARKKKGVWSKLKFWGEENDVFQLSLTGVGDITEIVVLNNDGKWETGNISGELLSRLNQELNAAAL